VDTQRGVVVAVLAPERLETMPCHQEAEAVVLEALVSPLPSLVQM
jgi:hypothetical protein